eukprot:Skav217009  [mRNA]  locus=scaffold1803:195986:198608:- [translate_table: standard]
MPHSPVAWVHLSRFCFDFQLENVDGLVTASILSSLSCLVYSGDGQEMPVGYVKTAKEAALAAKDTGFGRSNWFPGSLTTLTAQELQEELDGMCEVTARVAVALKSSVEETAQTREAVALLNDQVKLAEAALRSSPALESDEHLQRCLHKVSKIGHSALFSEVSGVFGRLWNDSLDRQRRRFSQAERREKIVAAVSASPVYVLDTRLPSEAKSIPEGKSQTTQKPSSRPGSAMQTLQLDETKMAQCDASKPSSPSRAPSHEKSDAHRRPSKTLLPTSDMSFPSNISKRRASAPDVVTRSWCLSDRRPTGSSASSTLPPPGPPSPSQSLIIRSVSPSPSHHPSPRLDVPEGDELAFRTNFSIFLGAPHAPLHPKTGPRSPRPQHERRPSKSRPEESLDMDDPLQQARVRPRAVPPLASPLAPPLAPIGGTQSPSRSSSKPPRETRSTAWHAVPNDANGPTLRVSRFDVNGYDLLSYSFWSLLILSSCPSLLSIRERRALSQFLPGRKTVDRA